MEHSNRLCVSFLHYICDERVKLILIHCTLINFAALLPLVLKTRTYFRPSAFGFQSLKSILFRKYVSHIFTSHTIRKLSLGVMSK